MKALLTKTLHDAKKYEAGFSEAYCWGENKCAPILELSSTNYVRPTPHTSVEGNSAVNSALNLRQPVLGEHFSTVVFTSLCNLPQ